MSTSWDAVGILVNVQPPNNTPSTPLFCIKGRCFFCQLSTIGPLSLVKGWDLGAVFGNGKEILMLSFIDFFEKIY